MQNNLTKEQFKAQTGYELGSTEATNYLLGDSKKVLDTPVGEIYKEFMPPKKDEDMDQGINTGIDLYGGLAKTPVNEEQIRSNTLSRFQREIDATNRIYAEMLGEAKTQGLGRLGTNNAISARSGTLGSDFGAASNEKVVKGNNAIENAIRAEEQALVAQILGRADQAATEEITNKRKAQTEGLDSYLKYLGARTERKEQNMKSLAASLLSQKVDPTQIDPTQLKKIAESYGVTTQEIVDIYSSEKKTLEDIAAEKASKEAKDRRVELGEGQALYELQDDGTYKALAKNPKTFNPSTAAGNLLTGAEAIKRNLPQDLVGKSEEAIIASLNSSDIPLWFQQKANAEANATLTPEALGELWEPYRNEVQSTYKASTSIVDEINALVGAFSQAQTNN